MDNFGWVNDPERVNQIVASMPVPYFTDAGAHLRVFGLPEEVFLWKACERVTGGLLPPRNQGQVGSCVSFGTASAIEHIMCTEIVSGEAESYKDLCHEVIYAGSRVEVGGGRLGNGDGSLGAWAADFVKKWGVVPREKIGQYDLTRYDEARCKSWGRSGVPDDLEPEARKHPVGQIAMVRSFEEACTSLANGYAIAVCSNVGFANQVRDKDGFVRRKGEWGHCMAIIGYTRKTRPGCFILNSWGLSPTMNPPNQSGPIGIGNHSPAGFWVDAQTIDEMLSKRDSWSFGGVNGFKAKDLNWLI